MTKIFFSALILLSSSLFNTITAQIAPDSTALPLMTYTAPKDYELGEVKVTGSVFTDASALRGVSGLQTGKKIKFPGTDVPKAMKALWKLRLFDDVRIIKTSQIGDVINLEIQVKERPHLTVYSYNGTKKSQHDDLNAIVNRFIPKGTIITENNKQNVINGIEGYFKEKGFLDAAVNIKEVKDDKRTNGTKLVIDVEKNRKVKIEDIKFVGNANASDKKLRKKMEKTHQRWKLPRLNLFSSSKLLADDYADDKKKIQKYYSTIGFRDAKVVSDSIYRDKKSGNLEILMRIEEGRRYYFRDITWKGNSIYDPKVLTQVLGIQKGDIYNQELLENRLRFSQDGRDVSSLYMDNGYLFFNVEPTETSIQNDSIDLEMRIFEGPQASIDKVIIKGNDITHDHVIRRELRTLPGQKFSRSDIIRSQREIINLGYFNQEALGINTPVNQARGTVDIEYKVEEKPSDQLELSAGYGGFGVVGTLGVSFNNFSMGNVFKKDAWAPLPKGDGQRVSIRAQSSGQYFQSYNASFTEPWLGGKKPNSLTIAAAYSHYNYGTSIGIAQASVSLGRRLKWPDDNFISSTSLEYQNYSLGTGTGTGSALVTFNTGNGDYNSVSISQTISRSSIADPLFPKTGSKFTLIAQASPPYSLFNGKQYDDLTNAEKFHWVEFFKWRFNAEWYTGLFGKFVLKTAAKFGSLGYYNSHVGYSPFGHYVVGGNGLANRQVGLTGNEIISLRGYDVGTVNNTDLPGNIDPKTGNSTGGVAFVKYSTELRYPVSLNPSSTIYVLAFADGGNVWQTLSDFRPFDVKRTVGAGLRVFLPMFGTLGFDYGIGFDKPSLNSATTSLTGYGVFSIILGFEPE